MLMIKDVSEKGITDHIIHTLERFGLNRIYQRENLSGCAMEGQYILLNINDHLHDTFFKDYHVTWDPAFRIELSLKDTTGHNFIESTCEKCFAKLSLNMTFNAALRNTVKNQTHFELKSQLPDTLKNKSFWAYRRDVIESC